MRRVEQKSEPDLRPESRTQIHHPGWRAVGWFFTGLLVLLALAVGALDVLLHSQRVHDYALAIVQQKASERLGTKVTLENFTIHLHNLSLDLYGLTVDGAKPYADPPLLQVQHAHIGVQIVSVLQRKWYLDSVVIDRPVVKLFVDPQGVLNLPTLKSTGGSSNTSVFDLGIRHTVLASGEAYYNNRKSVLAGDLHDVEFHAGFNSALQQYSGRLSYSDGHLVSGSWRSIPHNFEAQFDATPTTFHLIHARLTSGPTHLLVHATLENYSQPEVQAGYEALVDGAQFRQILNNPSVPAGLVHTAGTLRYHALPNRPPLDALFVNGNISSEELAVNTPSLHTRIDNLYTDYVLANGDAALPNLRADLLGGQLTAAAKMTDLSGSSHSEVHAALRGVSLEQTRRVFAGSALPPNLAVAGTMEAQANATWGKTLDDLVAESNVTVNGHIANTPNPAATTAVVPVESAIHATYRAANQQLALASSYLRTPQTTLTLDGTVSDRSSLALNLQANDLRELETIADLFRPATPGHPAQPFGLAGTASFQGTVHGSTAAPHLTGQLQAADLQLAGSAWKTLRTRVDVSPSFASLQNADLEPASRGRIAFNASTGLTKWSFTKQSPLQIDMNASQLNVADLLKLAGSQAPITGTLNAKVQLHGTQLNPIGQGTLSLTGATVYAEPIQSVNATFSGTGGQVQGNLAVQLPAGNLHGQVSVRPQARTYTAQLIAPGIRLDKLQAVKAKNLTLDGALSLNVEGQGSFDNPALDASLQIPHLVAQKQTITGLNLQMHVADHVANATLSSSAVNTQIQAKARVQLTGDYLANATLDTQSIPLQPIAAIYAPAQADALTGQTELHATLNGPLKNRPLLEAHVTIPTLQLTYNNTVHLAATGPVHLDYKNGVIDLARTGIRGTDTDLQLQGSIPTTHGAPMSVLVLGTVNLQLAQLFNPDLRTSGTVKFNLNSYGAPASANIGGEIDIVDANFASADLPVGLQHGNGVLTLTKDRLSISKFQGVVGGGTVTAQGGVAYQSNLQFDFGVAAQGIRVLYPDGVREGINANLRLFGTTENATLGGSVDVSDLSFTPAFDLTNFISQFSGGVSPPPSQGISQNIQLNIAVRSSSQVNLSSRTLSIGGTANLQLRGTAAAPVLLGRVNLNSGDIILNGNRFVLNGGTIQFVNPAETEPVVNLTLNTTIQQYDISLRFNGPMAQLHTDYSSDPALPSADIINLLAFGQTTEANSANPSTPANQQAESLVASQVSSQVTSRLSKVAGISQLSINPVLAGSSNQGPPGANITIQQRVTGNLFVTFSSNVASTQSQIIQGQYQISPRLAVSATRDQNGGFAVDGLIKKSW
jgi:translocation and assembly module TamB